MTCVLGPFRAAQLTVSVIGYLAPSCRVPGILNVERGEQESSEGALRKGETARRVHLADVPVCVCVCVLRQPPDPAGLTCHKPAATSNPCRLRD